MNPQEALNILDQIASQVNLTRQQHQTVIEAVQTLEKYLSFRNSEEDKSIQQT